MYDILIKHGQIVDGSGAPAFYGDIAVKDGKIARIAPEIDEPAERIIDADGKQVTPGFIDTHSHSDRSVYFGNDGYNYLEQGVTTQVAGQCGSGLAPYYSELKHKHRLSDEEVVRWSTIGAKPSTFMEYAETVPMGTNTAYFLGHSAVRGKVMGMSDAHPTPEQTAEMQAYVKDAMESGYLGMSTGLVYAPSVYSTTEELIDLAKIMAPYGGMYVSHIRGEGNSLIPAVREVIRIAEEAKVPAFISHLKVMGASNAGASWQVLREMDEAAARGVDVYADQYPYTAGSAPLSSQIPPKFLVGGTDVWLENIKKPEVRQQILYSIFNEVDEFESGIFHAGFDGSLITSAAKTPELVNKTLGQIAREQGKEPIDAMCDLLIANGGVAQGVYFHISVPDLMNIMAHPRVFCGADTSNWGNERIDPEKVGGGHPRSAGTTVRRLELVRDFRLRTMEESVKNITWDAAQALKLGNHGKLCEGWNANIAIIEYDKLHACADYVHPRRRCQGVHWVLVNGTIAVENGISIPGVRAGKVIKRANS